MRLIIAFLIASLCGVAYAKPASTSRGKAVAKEAYLRAKRGRKNFSRYRRSTRRRTVPKTKRRRDAVNKNTQKKTVKTQEKPTAPKRREQRVEAKNNKKALTSQKYNSMMLLWVEDILRQQ